MHVGGDMDTLKAAQGQELKQVFQRKWGESSLQTGREVQAGFSRKIIPTGFAALDQMLGIGGIPYGEITLLDGRITSGITSLAYHLIASAQQQGIVCAYLDISQTFDPEYAVRQCGAQEEELLLIYPENVAHAFTLARDVLLLPYNGLLVVDAALLVPSAQYSAFRPGLSRLKLPLKQSRWTLLGLLPQGRNWESLTSSLHLSLIHRNWQYTDDTFSGMWVTVHIRKNLSHPSTKSADILIEFGDEIA
jgi:recA bacterial DNA recombination protein